MKFHTKNLFSSTKILVLVLLIVAAITFIQKEALLNNIYSGRQLASVGSGLNNCYTDSDISLLESNNSVTIDQLQDINSQLLNIESQIQDTVFQMKENDGKIEELNASLVSEDTIQNQAQLIQNLQTEASKLQTILDLASSTAFQKAQILEKGKILTTLNGKIYPLKTYKLNDFKLQLKEKEAIDLKNKTYTDEQKKLVIIRAKYDASMVIERKEIEIASTQSSMTRASNTKNNSVGAARVAAQADFDKLLARYNMLSAQLATLNKDFNAKYGKVVPTRGLNTITKVVKKELDDSIAAEANLKQEYKSLESRYANTYKNDIRTAVELKSYIASVEASIVSMETEYKNTKKEYDQIATNNTQETTALVRLKNEFAQMYYVDLDNSNNIPSQDLGTKNISKNQGDYDANLRFVNMQIDTAQTAYDSYVALRNASLQEIQTLTDLGISLFATITSQTREKAELKSQRVEFEQRAEEFQSEIYIGYQNICSNEDIPIPEQTLTSEMYCNDALDDDNDGQVDCNDTDCSNDSVCVLTSNTVSNNTINNTPPPALQELLASPVSEAYNTLLASVSSYVNKILGANENTIVPQMQSIKTMSVSPTLDLQVLFGKMEDVKSEINANQNTVSQLKSELSRLDDENKATTDDPAVYPQTQALISSGNSFVTSFASYHTTLLEFLTGEIPPPDLEDKLDIRISDITAKSNAFKQSLNETTQVAQTALETVTEKNRVITLANESIAPLKVVSISPAADAASVPVETHTISIKFEQNIVSYNRATFSLRAEDGSVVTHTQMSVKDENTFTIDLASGLSGSAKYTASLDAVFVLNDTARTEKAWSQTWTFSTEQITFVDSVIDFFKDLFTDDDAKAPEICTDDVDNDDDGNVDCNDSDCADHPSCVVPECGNEKIEKGEECDDGNNIPGDGCYQCISETPPGSESCPDVDGDGYHDETKELCPVPDEEEGGSCLICEYGVDSEGKIDFEQECKSISGTYDEEIIYNDKSSVRYTSCPAQATYYKIVINAHSDCDYYTKAGSLIRKLLSTIQSTLSKRADKNEKIVIDAIDTGCISAGGEYKKDSKSVKDFEETIAVAFAQGFRGTINQTVNQTYGITNNGPVESPDPGAITYSAQITNSGPYKPFSVSPRFCPNEGEECPFGVSTEVGKVFGVQPIICGNFERYYCEISSTGGKWKNYKNYGR